MIPLELHGDPWPRPSGFRVVTVATSLETAGSTYGPWKLDLHALAWIAEGGGTTHLGDRSFATEPGSVLAMRPGLVLLHDWGPRRTIHCFVVFHFDRLRPPWPPTAEWPLHRQLAPDDFLFAQWRYLLRLDPARDAMLVVPMVELMLRFFLLGAGGRPHSVQDQLPAAVDRALAFIGERLARSPRSRVTLAAMAKTAGVSPQHLARLFREHLGVAPVECALAFRVELASGLLERSDRTLAEIAERHGFSSAFHFSRAFKASYGVPPSEYRRAFREQRMTRPTGLIYRNHRLRRYFYEGEPGRILV